MGYRDVRSALNFGLVDSLTLVAATAIYAGKALPTAGVPNPPFLITGDICDRGKPDPEPYLRGAEALRLAPHQCELMLKPYLTGHSSQALSSRTPQQASGPAWRLVVECSQFAPVISGWLWRISGLSGL